MRRKISQREARRDRKELEQLRRDISSLKYRGSMPDHYGTHVDTINVTNTERMIVATASLLKHTVFAVGVPDKDQIKLYAMKQ